MRHGDICPACKRGDHLDCIDWDENGLRSKPWCDCACPELYEQGAGYSDEDDRYRRDHGAWAN